LIPGHRVRPGEAKTWTAPSRGCGVLVTSEAKTDSILMAGKHSATAYIVKPFCFAEFVATIRQVFVDTAGQ